MSTPTAAELREALENVKRYYGMLRMGPPTEVQELVDAARLLALILEHGEEMEWCLTHADWKSPHVSRSTCRWSHHVLAGAPKKPCRFTTQVRFPSAVVDPAKNEGKK